MNTPYIDFRLICLYPIIFAIEILQAGAQIPVFEPQLIHKLKNEKIGALYADKEGYLWIGLNEKGIARYNGYQLDYYLWGKKKPGVKIQTILKTDAGILYLGTNHGLTILQNDKLLDLPDNDLDIHDMVNPSGQDIQLATQKGLWSVSDQIMPTRVQPDKFPDAQIYDLYYSNNILWMCSESGWYSYYKHLKRFDQSQGLNGLSVKGMIETRSDNFILFCDGSQPQYYQEDHFISPITVNKLNNPFYDFVHYERDQKRAWVIPSDKYLYVWQNPLEFQQEPLWQKIYEIEDARFIIQDHYGQIWISAKNGLWKADPQSWKQFQSTSTNAHKLKQIVVDSAQRIWTINTPGQLGRFVGPQAKMDNLLQHFSNQSANQALARDHHGNIWIINPKQVGVIKNDQIQMQNLVNNLPHFLPLNVRIDYDGNFWMITNPQKLVRITHQRGSYVTEDIPLPPGFHDREARDLDINKVGACWLIAHHPVNGDELWSYNSDTWIHHPLSLNLQVNKLNDLVWDQNDRIWLGTDQGILAGYSQPDSLELHVLSNQELLADLNITNILFNQQQELWVSHDTGVNVFFDAKGQIIKTNLYKWNQSMQDAVSLIDLQFDHQGFIWAHTTEGIFYLETRNIADSTNPPGMTIRSIQASIQDSILNISADQNYLDLTANINSLTIDCESINLSSEQLFFQWKWNDQQWSTPSLSSNLQFSYFPVGKNSLSIRCCTQDYNCSKIKSITIHQRRPWYQKTWFLMLGIGVLIFLTGLLFYLAQRRQRKHFLKNQQELQRKYELLSLEQQAKQNQMNPHFIFNVLNSIKGTMTGEHNRKARLNITGFAQLMRKFLDHSRKSAISIREDMELLNLYVHMEETLRKFPIEINWQVNKDLEMDYVLIPPMIIQPIIENAIIHGIVPQQAKMKQSGGGKIDIIIVPYGRYLKTTIIDNGQGYKLPKEKLNHRSAGLETIRRRLNLLLKNSQVNPLKVQLQKNENGMILGTMVELIIPILN